MNKLYQNIYLSETQSCSNMNIDTIQYLRCDTCLPIGIANRSVANIYWFVLVWFQFVNYLYSESTRNSSTLACAPNNYPEYRIQMNFQFFAKATEIKVRHATRTLWRPMHATILHTPVIPTERIGTAFGRTLGSPDALEIRKG